MGVLLYEMLAGKSPFDIGGQDMPDQSTEDYLFQGMVVTPKREKKTFKLFHEYLITRDIICVLCPPLQ